MLLLNEISTGVFFSDFLVLIKMEPSSYFPTFPFNFFHKLNIFVLVNNQQKKNHSTQLAHHLVDILLCSLSTILAVNYCLLNMFCTLELTTYSFYKFLCLTKNESSVVLQFRYSFTIYNTKYCFTQLLFTRFIY